MNKTALISGTSRGLGEVIARNFLTNGWNVIGISRSSATINEPNYSHYVADISNYGQIESALSNIPHIDLLVNNAAIFTMSEFEKTSISQISNILDVNLKGAIFLTKLAIPKMSRGGKIIFINSVAGLSEIINQSVYCASKHGLTAFAGVLGQELRSDGIVVSSIHPGGINTPLWNNSNPYPAGNSDLALDPAQVADTIYYITQTDNNTIIKNITLFPNIEWH